MDLDELRDALNEAGNRTTVDTLLAREAVGARAGRSRRRRRSVSLVALAAVIALVGGTVAVTAAHTHKRLDVKPAGATGYADLPSRSGAALAYDSARAQTVLFGGTDSTRTYGDTWLWDGTGWAEANSAVSPPARQGAVMAFDPETKEIVLFGGTRSRTGQATLAFNDTWTWDGATWTERHPAHVPPWNSGLAMSYDPRSRSVLLLTLPTSHPNLEVTPDSVSSRGSTPFGTWRWSGSDWAELPTPSAPVFATQGIVFHVNPRLAPLPDDAGLLFYSWAVFTGSCPVDPNGQSACKSQPDPHGTIYSQTWTWDGTEWTQQHPTNAPVDGELVATPGPRAEPFALASDGRPWHWTGSNWIQGAATRPAPIAEGSAVYDEARSELVAYTGRLGTDGAFFDTWTWNGSWTERASGAVATTTTAPSTSTTVPLAPDPLPAGSLMLGVSGRTISVLDARGNDLETLVTAFAGRTVRNAQLMPDHRTIWYATHADDNRSCPEVVKLDLKTNERTVVAHAEDFSLSADGSKLLLVWPYSDALVANNCRAVPLPSGASAFEGAFVERDLTTGEQWILPSDKYPSAGTGGPTGHVFIVPGANALIDAICVEDGCFTHTYSVPSHRPGLIVEGGAGPACGCSSLVSGPGGVYGVDEGSINHGRTFVRRYDADRLAGSGTVIAGPNDVTLGSSLAPTDAGVFVIGLPVGTRTTNLYRVDNGGLELIAPSGSSILAIPPFDR